MKNEIKAIEFIRKIREQQYNDIKDKDHTKIIEYFRNKANETNKNISIPILKK